MSLIALLLALAAERGLTHFFHLRELRWLDRYYDWAARTVGRGGEGTVAAALAALVVPVLPVLYRVQPSPTPSAFVSLSKLPPTR